MDLLYARYKGLVLSIGFKILHDHAEAEDLAQDVFLEICKRAERYDAGRGSVRLWILQYAYTRSFDRRKYLLLRHGIGSNGIAVHVGVPQSIVNESAPRQLASAAASPWKETTRDDSANVCDWSILREHQRIVCKLLEKLPVKQKTIIGLVYFQGLPMKDIAEKTQDSLANVRQHYYRGLRKLKEERKRARVL